MDRPLPHPPCDDDNPNNTPRHTYVKGGAKIDPGGAPHSKCDTILCNVAAHPLIEHAKVRWDLAISDHVPLQVGIRRGVYRQQETVLKPRVEIPLKCDPLT